MSDNQEGLSTEAADGFSFNMAEQAEDAGFEPLPVGSYDAIVESCEFTLSKSSGAPMWALKYAITGPAQYAEQNRKMFGYVSWKEEQRGRSKKIVKALAPELLSLTNFDPKRIAEEATLVGRPCRLRLKIEPASDQYPARNGIADVQPARAGGEGGGEGGGNFNL
jgi:hypothetical protein